MALFVQSETEAVQTYAVTSIPETPASCRVETSVPEARNAIPRLPRWDMILGRLPFETSEPSFLFGF